MFRGVIMTSAVWALVWAIVGVSLRVASAAGERAGWILLAPLQLWLINGAIAGAVFAVLLVASRRRSIGMLSLARVAGWGTAASLALPVGVAAGAVMRNPDFFSEASPLPQLLTFATAGAITAAGSLWLARRATDNGSGGHDSGRPPLLDSAASGPSPSRSKETARARPLSRLQRQSVILTRMRIASLQSGLATYLWLAVAPTPAAGAQDRQVLVLLRDDDAVETVGLYDVTIDR